MAPEGTFGLSAGSSFIDDGTTRGVCFLLWGEPGFFIFWGWGWVRSVRAVYLAAKGSVASAMFSSLRRNQHGRGWDDFPFRNGTSQHFGLMTEQSCVDVRVVRGAGTRLGRFPFRNGTGQHFRLITEQSCVDVWVVRGAWTRLGRFPFRKWDRAAL